MLQIEKIVHASDLKENFIVTTALISEANDESNAFVDWTNFEFVKPEHDLEGIYKIVTEEEYTKDFQRRVTSLDSEINYVVKSLSEIGAKVERPKFSLDSVAQRKTEDGQKLYKSVNRYIQKAMKMSSEFDFSTLEQDAGMMVKINLDRNIDDVVRALKNLELLDQQGGHFQKVNTQMYVRLSFRTQDVAGMSSLGNFTSCQDIRYHGWDCNSVGVLGSLLSESIGTLTLFNSLEDALTRDTERLYSQAEHLARVTIARDIEGSVHLGSKIYTYNDEHRALLNMFIEQMETDGKTIPYHDMKQIQVARDTVFMDAEIEYRYHGDLDFNVDFYSYNDDELLEIANKVLTDDDEDAEEFEELEEAIEAIEEKSLTSEFECELLELFDITNYDFCQSYLSVDDTEDRGLTWTIQDYDVNDYVDGSTLQENLVNDFSNLDIHELMCYLNDGQVTVSAYVEIEHIDTDGREYQIEPYLEGSVNRLSVIF